MLFLKICIQIAPTQIAPTLSFFFLFLLNSKGLRGNFTWRTLIDRLELFYEKHKYHIRMESNRHSLLSPHRHKCSEFGGVCGLSELIVTKQSRKLRTTPFPAVEHIVEINQRSKLPTMVCNSSRKTTQACYSSLVR